MNRKPIQRCNGLFTLAVGAALVVSASAAFAQAKPLQGQVVKLVRIDPLSGLLGPVRVMAGVNR